MLHKRKRPSGLRFRTYSKSRRAEHISALNGVSCLNAHLPKRLPVRSHSRRSVAAAITNAVAFGCCIEDVTALDAR